MLKGYPLIYAFFTTILICFTQNTSSAPTRDDIQQRLTQRLMPQATQALLTHHKLLLSKDAMKEITTELLLLRHGSTLDRPASDYLSEFTVKTNGNRDFKHAVRLGRWLGSIRVASGQRRYSPETASRQFAKIVDAMLSESSNVIAKQARRLTDEGIIDDIKEQKLSFCEAMELFAYGDINSSEVTTEIGRAIRAVERNALPDDSGG